MEIIISHLNFGFLLLITIIIIPLFLARTLTLCDNCPSKCGDVAVLYPFGIVTPNATCSINPLFDIHCDSSFNPPKAFLTSDNLEVLDIQDTTIRVKNRLASICFENDWNMTQHIPFSFDLSKTPFTFSTQNKLTVVGCDDISAIVTGASEPYDNLYSCMCFCSKDQDLINGSCSGFGCCQSSIDKDLQYIHVMMVNMLHRSYLNDIQACGYSFLAEDSSYNFLASDISDSSFVDTTIETVPVLIDWAIGDQSCVDQSHVCEGNSVCVDSGRTNGGYWCNCSQGYQGNPYLSPGCQDINECQSYPCHPKGICINLPGSYKCTCPPGYIGDGTMLGTGCISLTRTTLYAGLLIGLGLISLLGGSCLLYKMLRKRRAEQRKLKHFKRNGGLLLLQQQTAHDSVLEKMRIFTSKELVKATDQFNQSRILGQGGQGTVYKGMLSDGRIVAVKKSKQVNEGQLAEFINEVVILSQVNHRNVVRLLGCCLETQVPLLVYEFIPNGTLYHLIHDDSIGFQFTWDLRLRIASEIVNALAYLQYATPVPVYHRDMKSSNVLLDDKYRAKVSDFGISRSVAIDQTHLTTKVKGTFGYLDPEYFRTSKFTEKSDVYSFGVVLVELLTGQKPIFNSEREEEEMSLVMHFLLAMEENRLETILDSRIVEEGVNEERTAVANLAKRCLSLSGKKRPTVREVASELESIRTCSNLSFVVDSSDQDMSSTEADSPMLSAEGSQLAQR